MAYFFRANFWLLFFLGLYACSSVEAGGGLGELVKAVGQLAPFVKTALSLWQGYNKLEDFLHPKHEVSVGQQISSLISKVDEISKDMTYYHDDLSSTLTEMSKYSELRTKMKDFTDKVSDIEDDFKLLTDNFQFVNYTYEDVKESIDRILTQDSLSGKLQKMLKSLTEMRDDDTDLFQLMLDPDLKAKQVCSKRASIQQKIFSVYELAHDTLVKGLLMLIFANKEHNTKSEIAKEHGIEKALMNYFNNTKAMAEIFGNGIDAASRDMWVCDPPTPIEGKTYERFGRAFQKYLFSARNGESSDLRNVENKSYCFARCEDVSKPLYEVFGKETGDLTMYTFDEKDAKNHRHFWGPYGMFHNRMVVHTTNVEKTYDGMHSDYRWNRCLGGTLHNCKTIEQKQLEVCTITKPKQVEKYAYIKSDKWTYGSESSCGTDRQKINITTQLGFFEKIYPWRQDCNYCMCTCDYGERDVGKADTDTDRYINLSPEVADKGYVVTGVRLKKVPETHTFHLQIQQAELLANGRVSKAHWKRINTYYPREILDPKENSFISTEGVDYHKITHNNTIVYLDNVLPPRDSQVVTGVTFEVHRGKSNGKIHVGLAVRFSDVDIVSGNVSTGYKWYPELETTLEQRVRVNVEDLNVPTSKNAQNKVFSSDAGYVELANSGLEYDVGQNVLPFVDVQDVETKPSVPLAGVGLYHRGFKGSGGYLGLKATIFNLKRMLPDTKLVEEERQKLFKLVRS